MSIKWKTIKDFPRYEVSDFGEVRNRQTMRRLRPWLVLSHSKPGDGYPTVRLWPGPHTKLVHVLVLEAFVGGRPADLIANHKDGNKSNNRVRNLEWTTYGGNIQHAYDNGLRESGFKRKISDGELWLMQKLIDESGCTYTMIAKMFKVDASYISWRLKRGGLTFR